MNRDVLVLGLGVTGIGARDALIKMGYNVYTYDENKTSENVDLNKVKDFLFCIKSPGIKPSSEIIKKLEGMNIIIISDAEFFSMYSKCKNIIGVTGTNGKTTSVELINHILKSERTTHLVGNVGKSIMDCMDAESEDVMVMELSSFQLEYTHTFKPKIAIITNITSDHIDWHGSFENYVRAKYKIFANLDKNDSLILNGEDERLAKIKDLNCKIYYFSKKDITLPGAYLDGDKIFYRDIKGEVYKVMDVKDIPLPGAHNLENVLCSVLACILEGMELSKIAERVKTFKGVEHRIEFVRELNGVSYYNDSKGTNPDSTIKAIQAFDKNIVLIAGGYNKNIDFRPLFEVMKHRVKHLVLLGETRDILKSMATEFEIPYTIVSNMKEAVDVSHNLAINGEIVLLSPACASWDMYKNYEERGREFKEIVKVIE